MIKQSWINWRILLVDNRELTFGEKAIGLYLNTYMNERQDFAFPSIARICGEMAISNKTAIKYLSGLEEKGFIQKTKRFNNSVIYHAIIPSSVKRTLVEDLHHSSVGSTLTVVEDLHSNKQINKQTNKQAQCANDCRFIEFWELYPNKKDKKRAETAFNRMSKKKQDLAIKDIKTRFKETDKKFIPHPTTYINGERWEDEKTSYNGSDTPIVQDWI